MEWIEKLLTPEWAVSVVVTGVVINLVSTWLTRRIDRYQERRNEAAKRRLEADRSKCREFIEQLRADPRLVQAQWEDELRDRISAVFLYLGCVLVAISAFNVPPKPGHQLVLGAHGALFLLVTLMSLSRLRRASLRRAYRNYVLGSPGTIDVPRLPPVD